MVSIERAIADLRKAELVGEDIVTTEGEIIILLYALKDLRNATKRIVERLEEEKASCQHYDKDGKWHYEETARKNGIIQAIAIVKAELN